MPKTFDKFQELKYTEFNKWEDLKYYYRNIGDRPIEYVKIDRELENLGITNKGKAYPVEKIEIRGWRSHAERRLTESKITKADGITTAKQYEQRAVELLESKTDDNILGHMDKDGNIIRYDKDKNDFVKGNTQKGIFTMFKPDSGQKYYNNQRKEDIERGGQA